VGEQFANRLFHVPLGGEQHTGVDAFLNGFLRGDPPKSSHRVLPSSSDSEESSLNVTVLHIRDGPCAASNPTILTLPALLMSRSAGHADRGILVRQKMPLTSLPKRLSRLRLITGFPCRAGS
jgi:hypothetical protein